MNLQFFLQLAERKLIGQVDPGIGEIIPIDGHNRKKKEPALPETADYKKLYEKI